MKCAFSSLRSLLFEEDVLFRRTTARNAPCVGLIDEEVSSSMSLRLVTGVVGFDWLTLQMALDPGVDRVDHNHVRMEVLEHQVL